VRLEVLFARRCGDCKKREQSAAWSDSEWDNGIQIDQIEELTTLAVRTTNSLYEVTVLDGHTGEVLVRGGEFFPVRTPVRLEGSTCGGSILTAFTWVCGWRSSPSLSNL
jgi:hypothetical protein